MLTSIWESGMAPQSNLPTHLAMALSDAASMCGRLEQALEQHPLRPAVLFRTRLDAVRHMAAADGQMIDPWHLAALLEGLRLRMDSELRIIDRGQIFEAARHALELHGWLVDPDFDQEGEVQRAEAHLTSIGDQGGPLLSAGIAIHTWIEQGGTRSPIRAAIVRYWRKRGVFSLALPLTGAGAFRPDTPWTRDAWLEAFLCSLAREAGDMLELLRALDHSWRTARIKTADRRKNSHAAAAIDLLAAAPLLSATTLATALGIAVKNAARLLVEFCESGDAIEVTHRSKRRLYALANLGALRDCVAKPRRPDPFRARGRPPAILEIEDNTPPSPPLPHPAAGSRPIIEYGELEAAMAQAEATIRRTRTALDRLIRGEHKAPN